MIQFALLFGLGFLTAVLIVMMLAPAVHRRVVGFTEKRLRATTPLSAREVRAQKDMARAVYAAENAKAGQDLVREREKTLALQRRSETLALDAGRLQSENAELHIQINDMNVEAADMRSQLRREDSYVQQLKDKLQFSETTVGGKETEIKTMQKRINKLAMDIDNLRLDLASRDTQIDNLTSRVTVLRDERDGLRQDFKLTMQRAKEAETRLAQEEHKALRIGDRLAREQTGNADRDTLLERRQREIARLKDKLKHATVEMRDITRVLRQAGLAKPPAASKTFSPFTAIDGGKLDEASPVMTTPTAPSSEDNYGPEEIAALTSQVRNQNTALAERLARARTASHDAALRDEIADVAAKMVVLTALNEGETSPIHAILAPTEDDDGITGLPSLADRVRDMMSTDAPSA